MNAAPIRTQPVAPATPNTVSALTAVATPTAPDRPPEHDRSAVRRFAELLRQSRSERAAAAAPSPAVGAPSAAAPAPADESSGDPEPSDPPAQPAGTTAAAKTRSPTAKSATGKAAVEHAQAPAEPVAEGTAAREDATTPTSTGERAAALAMLAAAAAENAADRGSASAESTAGERRSAADLADATATSRESREVAPRAPGHARGAAVVDAANGGPASVDADAARAASLAFDPMVRAALGDALRAVDTPATRSRAVASDPAALSIGLAGATRAIGELQGPAPSALAFATPIAAPEFAVALGVQVSVLAQDGVQHAELHLNPAETGPVSIRISVDGDSARVEFGADLAATRQAIERGLPELASALRDAGLTLTGGGVSQHAGSPPGGDEAASQEHRGPVGTALPEVTGARVVRRVADGGVDLYA